MTPKQEEHYRKKVKTIFQNVKDGKDTVEGGTMLVMIGTNILLKEQAKEIRAFIDVRVSLNSDFWKEYKEKWLK